MSILPILNPYNSLYASSAPPVTSSPRIPPSGLRDNSAAGAISGGSLNVGGGSQAVVTGAPSAATVKFVGQLAGLSLGSSLSIGGNSVATAPDADEMTSPAEAPLPSLKLPENLASQQLKIENKGPQDILGLFR